MLHWHQIKAKYAFEHSMSRSFVVLEYHTFVKLPLNHLAIFSSILSCFLIIIMLSTERGYTLRSKTKPNLIQFTFPQINQSGKWKKRKVFSLSFKKKAKLLTFTNNLKAKTVRQPAETGLHPFAVETNVTLNKKSRDLNRFLVEYLCSRYFQIADQLYLPFQINHLFQKYMYSKLWSLSETIGIK